MKKIYDVITKEGDFKLRSNAVVVGLVMRF
jgi:hypothetical protein